MIRIHPRSEVTELIQKLLSQVLILCYSRGLSGECKGSVSFQIPRSISGYIKIKDIIAL